MDTLPAIVAASPAEIAASNLQKTFVCPITCEVMVDPVCAADGHSYEREAIERWFNMGKRTSPRTGNVLSSTMLIPNVALRQSIEEYLATGGTVAPGTPLVIPAADTTPAPPPFAGTAVRLALHDEKKLLRVSLNAAVSPVPLHLVAVIDSSSSMSNMCQPKSDTAEGQLYSRMDLVKHSLRAIVELMRSTDRLSLIEFESSVTVKLDNVNLSGVNKTRARNVVNELRPSGCTNLWGGLKAGVDRARTTASQGMHTAIVLLTDGEPTPDTNPPRGIVQTLSNMLGQHPDVFTPVYCIAYGYGRDLDSPLLCNIAERSRGSYAYVPDGSMVGTVFLNLLVNLMSVAVPNVSAGGMYVGDMHPGQTRIVDAPNAHRQTPVTGVGMHALQSEWDAPEVFASPEEIAFAAMRIEYVNVLGSALRAARMGNVNTAKLEITLLHDRLKQNPAFKLFADDLVHPDKNRGQVMKALDDWATWGMHYLPAFWFAHYRAEAANFKDASMQDYSTATMQEMMHAAEETFKTLPAPTPSIYVDFHPGTRSGGGGVSRGGGYSAAFVPNLGVSTVFRGHTPVPSLGTAGTFQAPATLSRMMDRDGGCVTGETLVKLASGEKIRADAVRKGMLMWGGHRVLCVTEFPCDRPLVCHFPDLQIGITARHPVRASEKGMWFFPIDCVNMVRAETQSVFNFVLETGHVLTGAQGVQFCTLAHGFTGPVISHPYYGTDAVKRDLMRMKGWKKGYILWDKTFRLVVDPVTNWVTGVTPVSSVA